MVAHVLGAHHFFRHAVAQGRFGFPFLDLLMPDGEFLFDRPLAHHFIQPAQRIFYIALNREMHVPVLVVLGLVDVDMNNRAGLAELFHFARDAVIETHAKSQQQIRAVLHFDHRIVEGFALLKFAAYCPVGIGRAVHSQPAQ